VRVGRLFSGLTHGRAVGSRLSIHLGQQPAHCGTQGEGQLVHDQDGRESLAALEQADVVAMHVGQGGERLLREAGGLAAATEHAAEAALERMHGGPSGTESDQCSRPGAAVLPTIVCYTIVFSCSPG
jgi:hypothetical protein